MCQLQIKLTRLAITIHVVEIDASIQIYLTELAIRGKVLFVFRMMEELNTMRQKI